MSDEPGRKKFSVKLLVCKISENSLSSSWFPSSSSSCNPSRSSSRSPSSRKAKTTSDIGDFTARLYSLGLKVGALHSAILYDDKWEIHFGNQGISMELCEHDSENVLQILDLGFTQVNFEGINNIIHNEMKIKFNKSEYSVMSNNCHHFSNELALRIVGKRIPRFLTDLSENNLGAIAVIAAVGFAILKSLFR